MMVIGWLLRPSNFVELVSRSRILLIFLFLPLTLKERSLKANARLQGLTNEHTLYKAFDIGNFNEMLIKSKIFNTLKIIY